jgi:hypothetical protein
MEDADDVRMGDGGEVGAAALAPRRLQQNRETADGTAERVVIAGHRREPGHQEVWHEFGCPASIRPERRSARAAAATTVTLLDRAVEWDPS